MEFMLYKGNISIFFFVGKWDPDKCDMATVIGNNYLTLSKLIEVSSVNNDKNACIVWNSGMWPGSLHFTRLYKHKNLQLQ